MATPVYTTGPLYVGEDRFVEADFSGFLDLFAQTGATVTAAIISGAGLSLTGGASWDHNRKRAQQRCSVSAGGNTITLEFHLVTVPDGLDIYGTIKVPTETRPT